MDSTIQSGKVVSWAEEVALFAKHTGSLAGFCRSRGLTEIRFRYWEQKLRKPGKSKTVLVSPFVAMKVEPKLSGVALPDARWLAEFLKHLSGTGR